MAHDHVVYDSDPHFTVDPDNRELKYTSPEKLTIMHNDHNSEIVTFDMPRYVDGHDMLLCNKIQVHFINVEANKSSNRVSGMYTVTDAHEDPEDSNKIIFSWPISRTATSLVGTLHFTLRFACMEGSRLTYSWNTAVYTGMSVSQSIDNTETIGEEYLDIVYKWYYDLVSAGTMGINAIADAVEEAIARIAVSGGVIVSDTEPTSPSVVVWVKPDDSGQYILRIRSKTTGKFEGIPVIKGDKGDPGGISNITHELGISEDLVLSQRGALHAIQDLDTDLTDLIYEKKNEMETKYREFVYSTKSSELIDDYYTLIAYHVKTSEYGEGMVVTHVEVTRELHDEETITVIIPSTMRGLPVIGIGATFHVPVSVSAVILPSTIQFFTMSTEFIEFDPPAVNFPAFVGPGAFTGDDSYGANEYFVLDCTMMRTQVPKSIVFTHKDDNGVFDESLQIADSNLNHYLVLGISNLRRCMLRVPSYLADAYDEEFSEFDLRFDPIPYEEFLWNEYEAGSAGTANKDFAYRGFFIGDILYTAKEGMTWGEWVDSKYNTIGATNGDSDGENIGVIYVGESRVGNGSTSVRATDIIEVNGEYSYIRNKPKPI